MGHPPNSMADRMGIGAGGHSSPPTDGDLFGGDERDLRRVRRGRRRAAAAAPAAATAGLRVPRAPGRAGDVGRREEDTQQDDEELPVHVSNSYPVSHLPRGKTIARTELDSRADRLMQL